jgi:hypothetical protein
MSQTPTKQNKSVPLRKILDLPRRRISRSNHSTFVKKYIRDLEVLQIPSINENYSQTN